MLPELTIDALLSEAVPFAATLTGVKIKGVNNSKNIGDFVQEKLSDYLQTKYSFTKGKSTSGVDFPSIDVDIKASLLRDPQSSSRYVSVRQKVFGLGYGILLFAYEHVEDEFSNETTIRVSRLVYISKERTGHNTTTKVVQETIDNGGNQEDIEAYLLSSNPSLEQYGAKEIAKEIWDNKPITTGYIGIYSAHQWRLKYRTAVNNAGKVSGVLNLL